MTTATIRRIAPPHPEMTPAALYRARRISEFVARNTTHGLHKTRENAIWREMKQRCSNPKHKKYPQYGGRGIKVCPEWESFERFYADMGPRPSDSHSIDRIDNDGDYELANCRWSTRSEQQRNKRNNRLMTHQGKTQPLSVWAKEIGINQNTLRYRIQAGWSDERALTSLPWTARP